MFIYADSISFLLFFIFVGYVRSMHEVNIKKIKFFFVIIFYYVNNMQVLRNMSFKKTNLTFSLLKL